MSVLLGILKFGILLKSGTDDIFDFCLLTMENMDDILPGLGIDFAEKFVGILILVTAKLLEVFICLDR